jgi:AGZA family xanthine/uracil permease-like MFS transporter
MAAKLAGHENRTDVTALPYGINTPAGFISAWNVMLPIAGSYLAVDPNMPADEWVNKTWQTACAVNFLGGIFEVLGSVFDIRPHFAKAALYAPVSAVGFVWLALVPLTVVAKEPIIGMVPLAMCFTGFFANGGKGVYTKLSGGTAMLIAIVGLILKWAGAGKYTGDHDYMGAQVTGNAEMFAGKNKLMSGPDGAVFPLGYWADVGNFVAVVFPVALQSFVETMENVEAAKAMGDEYNLREAMVVDGVGTMLGALMGGVLPTTVYIGHKRHKVIGAHAGYSVLNAVIYFILFNAGLFPMLYAIFDEVSIGIILIMVGLLICQQAIEVSATRHMPAFFIGIMCLICDCGRRSTPTRQTSASTTWRRAAASWRRSSCRAAIICDLIDNRYLRAAGFSAVAALFSLFGIMHGMNPVDVDGNPPSAFPFFSGGIMMVKGQLTVAIKDDHPGWTAAAAGGAICTQPPEFRVDQTTAAGLPADGMNEGWRFAVAYAMVFAFCLIHHGLQKMGWLAEPVMDNGVAKPLEPEYKKEAETTTATATA